MFTLSINRGADCNGKGYRNGVFTSKQLPGPQLGVLMGTPSQRSEVLRGF